MDLFFRLSSNSDPEERLEEACLWKSFYDEYGDELDLIPSDVSVDKSSVLIGRSKNSEYDIIQTNYGLKDDYWNFSVFKEFSNRNFRVLDWSEGVRQARDYQKNSGGVFIKSILRQKHFTHLIRAGDSVFSEIGDMAYSFIDRGDCLLVQEAKDMSFERRFFVVDRQIITHSPVANHITPLDRIDNANIESFHFQTPFSKTPIENIKLTEKFVEAANEIVSRMPDNHATFDLCIIEGKVSIIEFNPIKVGMLGNFAMNTRKIAESSRSLIRDVRKVFALYDGEQTPKC